MSGINLDQTTWAEISRKEWDSKLKKELKRDELDGLKIELEPGITYDPLKRSATSESQSITHFPILSYGQKFEISDPKTLNRSILKLLQNDLRVVSLEASDDTNWSEVLKDILPELIHMDINCDSVAAKEKFLAYRESQTNSDKWSISFNIRPGLKSDAIKLDFSAYKGLTQVELIKSFLWDVSNVSATRVVLQINVEENLLKIIPFARALRIAFEKRFPDMTLILSGSCDLDKTSADKNDALIRAGSVYMFCSMAGMDHLYLHSLKEESDLDHTRLLLNIQNMASLESKIDDKKDPLKGSVVIEDLTRQFLELV